MQTEGTSSLQIPVTHIQYLLLFLRYIYHLRSTSYCTGRAAMALELHTEFERITYLVLELGFHTSEPSRRVQVLGFALREARRVGEVAAEDVVCCHAKLYHACTLRQKVYSVCTVMVVRTDKQAEYFSARVFAVRVPRPAITTDYSRLLLRPNN